ncbi:MULTISPECIES: MHO_1580 family protein [unclassified Mycoplasma]|uniref:MHO_1580 family protein n=1 Tax=unclassified Mycoplasma TaxID=2683645 RepID=UPI00211BEB32|nr:MULTISPECIES: hypothetical protein [unclassified Mycoplasma]UUM19655.1 hypothetical protein NPA11_02695 [Mycoplasma sp. 1578d]UUM24624.1 hypothetical protein NPA12_02920 [Mycoplasma sp. 3686d]
MDYPINYEHKLSDESTYILDNQRVQCKWISTDLPADFIAYFNIDKIMSNGFFDLNFASNLENDDKNQYSVSILINNKVIVDHFNYNLKNFNLGFEDINLTYSKIKNIVIVFKKNQKDIGVFYIDFSDFDNIEQNIVMKNIYSNAKIVSEYNFVLSKDNYKIYRNYLNVNFQINDLSNQKRINNLGNLKIFYNPQFNRIFTKKRKDKSAPQIEGVTVAFDKFISGKLNIAYKNLNLNSSNWDSKKDIWNTYELPFHYNTFNTDNNVSISNFSNSQRGIILPKYFSGNFSSEISIKFKEFKLNFVRNIVLNKNSQFSQKSKRFLKIIEIKYFEDTQNSFQIAIDKVIDFNLKQKITDITSLLIYSKRKDE